MKHLFFILFSFLLVSCSQKHLGSKVKEPFSSSSYHSNNRYFRAVGKGESKSDNIAERKADMSAKIDLAQQVESHLREMSEQYLRDQEIGGQQSELNEQFQNLGRSLTHTTIADIRKLDEKKYFDGEKYKVYVAFEIKKKAMFRFIKKKAKSDRKMNESNRKLIVDIIDEELEKLED